jgi:plastocyanin
MKIRLTQVRGRLLVATVAVVVLAAFVAACGSSSNASNTPAPAAPAASGSSAATSNVSIQNLAFTPKTLTVSAGTKVTWTNNDSTVHNVISSASISIDSATTSTFASSTLSQGQTFSFTFTKKGVYFYECTIHKTLPAMHAEIVVK